MIGTGRDPIVPHTHTDSAATVSATQGVGAAFTAEADGTMAIRATITDMAAIDTDITMDIDTVTGTVTMTDYTLVTITTTSTTTDPSHTDISTVTVSTTAKPMAATTTEAIVPTWQAEAAWAEATTPTVHTPTTMAAV